jgi:hypothetical protein
MNMIVGCMLLVHTATTQGREAMSQEQCRGSQRWKSGFERLTALAEWTCPHVEGECPSSTFHQST